jgi:hypothetical protein
MDWICSLDEKDNKYAQKFTSSVKLLSSTTGELVYDLQVTAFNTFRRKQLQESRPY